MFCPSFIYFISFQWTVLAEGTVCRVSKHFDFSYFLKIFIGVKTKILKNYLFSSLKLRHLKNIYEINFFILFEKYKKGLFVLRNLTWFRISCIYTWNTWVCRRLNVITNPVLHDSLKYKYVPNQWTLLVKNTFKLRRMGYWGNRILI